MTGGKGCYGAEGTSQHNVFCLFPAQRNIRCFHLHNAAKYRSGE